MMYEQGGGAPPAGGGGAQGPQGQWFNAAASQGLAAAGVPDLYQGVAKGMVEGVVGEQAKKYSSFLHRWLNMDSLRYYFEINNVYVRDKIALVSFAPALHYGLGDSRFQFRVSFAQGEEKRPEPKYDLHAPDLYIPTMAFVTYVLLSAFALGTYGTFNPDIIFTLGWSCIGLVILEVTIIKGGLMFLNAQSLPVLDVLAFSGYKFVGLTWLVFWHITLGSFSTIAYYVVFLLFSSCMAFFLIKSLEKEMGMSTGGEANSVKILQYVIGALQIPFVFFMMP